MVVWCALLYKCRNTILKGVALRRLFCFFVKLEPKNDEYIRKKLYIADRRGYKGGRKYEKNSNFFFEYYDGIMFM